MNNTSKEHFLMDENSDFFYLLNGEGRREPIVLHTNVTVDISLNFVMSVTIVQSFSYIQKKS